MKKIIDLQQNYCHTSTNANPINSYMRCSENRQTEQ